MGQKINPTGFRLAVSRNWASRWYASNRDFSKMLLEDIQVRDFLKKKLKNASVGRVLIERPAKNARITIFSARPGVVIGKKGEDIENLKRDLAQRLGVPVGIHMGTGGNGNINISNPKYRASLGRPFLLEDMLAKHPKLKIWVMHAGYPMADEMIALMGANAYVYVDLAGFIWSYPLEEIHAYLQRLVQAGFGKRILYGTDLMIWPKLLETSIQVIESANYLSEDQKRDIFFNNAVRFFNLDASKFK